MNALGDAIDKLAALGHGWDGYDGDPPTEQALATCRLVHFTPMSSGGVMIELHALGTSVEIEIAPDGYVALVETTPVR